MDPFQAGVAACCGVILFTLMGVRIAYAAGITGVLGLIAVRGWGPGTGLSGLLAYQEATHYTLSVLPMFILIGYLAFHAGLTQGAFYCARCWMGRLPGGLAVATVFAAAGFGAVSGASTASAAVFARIAIPEMLRYGYDKRLAAATVAAGGTLASLIPPSAILVIYGIIVEQSVGALLLAGFIPGIISAINYALIIIVWCWLNPRMADPVPDVDWAERFRSLKDTLGIIAVIGIIVGGLYTGWMTPTEVGGAGAFIMFMLALANKTRLHQIWEAMRETSKLTVMIFTIVWSILILVRFLGFTGVPSSISQWIGGLGLPRLTILLMILSMYLVLGMFLDGIGMLLLTLPVVFPIVTHLGYDPIWFGIIMVKMVEIGLVTPPIGLNCFVVNGVRPDIPLATVFAGVWPFVLADCLTIALFIAVPEIVTFLPTYMAK
ncbi:MAG: TRAP transporter large permease, partial [Hyphomicrobiaceae bacterium]